MWSSQTLFVSEPLLHKLLGTLENSETCLHSAASTQCCQGRFDKRSRVARARKLRETLSGEWLESSCRHYCGPGCHDEVPAAQCAMVQALREAWLERSVPAPALNRWTKLFEPVAWFLEGLSAHNVLARSFKLWLQSTPGRVAGILRHISLEILTRITSATVHGSAQAEERS